MEGMKVKELRGKTKRQQESQPPTERLKKHLRVETVMRGGITGRAEREQ